MKTLLLIVVLIPFISQSQKISGLYSSIKAPTDKRLNSKNGKLAVGYTNYFIYKADTITIMRVPYHLINSRAKNEIIGLQNELDNVYKNFLGRKRLDLQRSNSLLMQIRIADEKWFIDYYAKEMVFYQRFEQYLKPREIFVEDSLSEVSRKLDLAKKKADSIDLAERTKGYYFVDVPYLSLLEQPSAKSKVIGIFWPYTYVKKLQEKEVNGYVKVKIDDHVGFVFSSFLVDRIDKVTVASPNKEAAYKGYFTSLMESTTVQSTIPSTAPSNHGTQSSELKSSSSLRTYYRGPKGGCYYFSSSGKKVYVDKSHCN